MKNGLTVCEFLSLSSDVSEMYFRAIFVCLLNKQLITTVVLETIILYYLCGGLVAKENR